LKSIIFIEYEHVHCSKYKLHGANGAKIGLVVGTEQYLKSLFGVAGIAFPTVVERFYSHAE
jgi:hypothetical protein